MSIYKQHQQLLAIFLVLLSALFFQTHKLPAQSPAPYSLSPVALFDGITYTHIFFAENGKSGWICGGRGVVLGTQDGGANWKDISPQKMIKLESTVAFKKIIFKPDNKTGWVIGKVGMLYKTTDGGDTWTLIKIKTKKDLIDIDFSFDYRTVRILNQNSEVFESDNEGLTWNPKISLEYNFQGVPSSEQSFLVYEGGGAIGVYEYIYYSRSIKDIGEHTEDSTDFSAIKKVKYISSLKKYLGLHDNGYLLSYAINGKWEKLGKIDSLKDAYDLCFDQTAGHIYVIGDFSKLYRSLDGGRHWELVFNLNHDGFDFYSISCSKEGKDIWICGSNRTIIHSNDYGVTWKYKTGNYFGNSYFSLEENNFSSNADVSETYYDSSSQLLYSAGDKGMISSTDLIQYKTKRLTPIKVTNKFFGLHCNQTTHNLFAVGQDLTIAKYSLLSQQTTIVYEQPGSNINLNSIYFSENGKIGLAVGRESTVLISRDSGNHWKLIDITADFVSFSDITSKKNKFYVVGEKGLLYSSDISAHQWTKQVIGDSTEYLVSIDFSRQSNTGFITTSYSKCRRHLYRSDDDGIKWQEVQNFPNSNAQNLQHVTFNDITNEIYVTDTYGGIYKSADNGLHWFKVFPWVTYQSLRFVSFDNNNNPIFSGDYGSLFICRQKDSLPVINRFEIIPSLIGNSFIPHIKVTDAEQNNQLVYSLSIVTDLAKGSDYTFKNQTVFVDNKETLEEFPSEIFVDGKIYTFRLTVFDGWNIITREITLTMGKSKLQHFAAFMGWSKFPTYDEMPKIIAKNVSLLAFAYALLVLLLFLFSPPHFIRWHEAVANSRLPLPENLSKFLVLFLIERDRSLNAFVKMHQTRAVALINSYEEVKSRSVWVKAPFTLDNVAVIGFQPKDNEQLYVPGLREIQGALRGERIIIRIEGQGGIGKTSLALQIYRWANETDKKKRLLPWNCLPLYIDKLGDKNLDEICTDKLEYLMDSRSISKTLVEALLRKKRIIVIVDGMSEMAKSNEHQYLPDRGGKHSHFIVFTSRKPLPIPESTIIYPMGLKIDFLDMLLDSFTNSYAEAYKFGEQREVLRNRIKLMLLELNGMDQSKPVALSLLKEIVKQASRLIDDEKPLAESLPKSVGELYDIYILDLFRNITNYELMIEDLRDVSLIAIGLKGLLDESFSTELAIDIKPTWIPKIIYIKFLPQEKIDTFISSGLLNASGELGVTYLKFTHDPLGEYLAGVKILLLYKQGIISDQDLKFIRGSSSSISFLSLLQSSAKRMGIYLP